jgi:two-component system sensor kinase FixL
MDSDVNADLQSEISALRARIKGILDAALDGFIVINEFGIVEAFNAAAERQFGYSAADVLGQNVSMLMPSPHRERHDQYITNYLRTGQRKIIGIGREELGKRADGSLFPIELSVGTVTVDGRSLFIGTIRDLTPRKTLERALQEQRDRLAHAGRVTTMGEMASGIAHEINQPLTAIATYAQVCKRLLREDAPNIDGVRDLLDQIGHQAMRAGEVIRRLRGFIQPNVKRLESFDINRVVTSTIELARIDSTHRNVAISTDLAPALPLVYGDIVQIEQALLNLLRNALDALSECECDHPSIEVKTRLNDNREIEVEVADNGPGVRPDIVDELFKPFFTTKEQGTGLGLSISHTIITSHNGYLRYAPREGGGARFCFSLPGMEERK